MSGLLYDNDGYWFEITKPEHWRTADDGVTEVGLGAIGGSLEPGESLLDCLQREALEEIGLRPAVLGAHDTLIVYEERDVQVAPGGAAQHPTPALLTVSANRYSRERLPDCATLAIVTYWARVRQRPRRGDLFGLVRLSRDVLEDALRQPTVGAADLLATPGVDASLVRSLPEGAVVRPVWTVRSLQLAWASAALALIG